MSSRYNHHDFSVLAQAFGLNAVDAARHVLEEAERGKQLPRWMRRAARAINRKARAA